MPVALEPLEPQLRGPLTHRRLGPAEPIGELDEATAAVLVVERVGQPNGRVLGRGPAPRHRLHHPRAGDLVAKPLEVRHPLAEILAWGVDPTALGTGLVVHSPERSADRGDKPSPDADDRPGRGVHQLEGWHVTPAPPRRDTETDRMWSALSSILRSTDPTVSDAVSVQKGS